MTTNYIGIKIDPTTDNYIVGSELLDGTLIDRKVNTPSNFQFKVLNKDAGKIDTYALDDVVNIHVGTEPLYQWGSLSALRFTGTSGEYVALPNLPLGADGEYDPFSVSLWFKRTGAAGGTTGNYHPLFLGFAGLSTTYPWIYLNDAGTSASLQIKDHNNVTVTFSIATTFNDNQWHHLMFTYDGSEEHGYFDGVLIDNKVVDGVRRGAAVARFGSNATGTYISNGVLDEVRIYNRDLTPNEVFDAFKGSPSSSGLVGCWSLNEGYGATVIDGSVYANNGTIYGAAWVNPKIMTGTIMDIDLERNEYGDNNLIIRGEDKLTVLGERLARATFPGAVDVSTILINLLTEFALGEYTTVNTTASGTTITNFTVGAETTLLALMRRLADLPGSSYDFYLDGGNDLVWHPRAHASWDSGITLNEDNIRRMGVNRSTREKKTFIKITGAQKPVEEAISAQTTVTDSVTLETNYYSDDFIAQHDNLMAVELYIQKIGTPGADLVGRVALSKYDMPAGDFLAFTLREEDISTSAGWYRIATPMNTQVGSRYFIRLDSVGADSSNTYKWYGDSPAVLDTERKAKVSTDGIYWTAQDSDLATKILYGEYAEVTALDASTPRRDGVVPLPSNSGIDDVIAQELADRILANYLQTAFKATVRFVAPAVELKPSYLITLDEAGDGLASKLYRVERVRMEFGVNRACDYYDIDISATLPYTYLGEEDSILREALLAGGGHALQSGASGEITTAKVGFAKVDYSYASIYPDET